MTRTFIYSYNPHSSSAKALSQALGAKRLKRENSRYRPRQSDTVINWGNSKLPDHITHSQCTRLNDDYLVAIATDKLRFFRDLSDDVGEFLVPWTTDVDKVREWLAEGKKVVARTKLTGHSGEGIVILEGADTPIVEAPLYTLYIPKKHEFRLHVFRNKENAPVVFDIQQKKRKTDVADEDVDWQIRNLDGGFIYAREELNVPECVTDVALQVFRETGLDFGAVDIIYNEQKNKAYALEVNSAPGLTGTTLDKYVEMFKELLE